MVRTDLSTWGLYTLSDLRRLAVQAQHPRSPERLLALHMIASQQTNATTWAAHIGRAKETVLNWVHQYNLAGLEGVLYHHTGGRSPLLTTSNSTNSSTSPQMRSNTWARRSATSLISCFITLLEKKYAIQLTKASHRSLVENSSPAIFSR